MDDPCPLRREDQGAGKAFLSFNISTQPFAPMTHGNASATRAAIDGGTGKENKDLSHDYLLGTEDERKISRLWVLLFKKDPNNPSAEPRLKYVFKFDKDNPIQDNYTDPNGGIAPLNEVGKTFIYKTSTKLVEPGDYEQIILANPTTYAVENMGTGQFAKAEDLIEKLKDRINPTTAPSFSEVAKMLRKEYINYQFLNGPRPNPTDNPSQDSNASAAVIPIRGLKKELFNDKDNNPLGLAAFSGGFELNIPKAYSSSPASPVTRFVELHRSLAKLVVSIDNMQNDGSAPATDSYAYKIKDIRLHMTGGFTLLPNAFVNVTDINSIPLEGQRAENKLLLRPILSSDYTHENETGGQEKESLSMIQSGQFPLLDRLIAQGFQKDEALQETELFNLYLPPYTPTENGSSAPAYEPVLKPQMDISTLPYVYLLVENKNNGVQIEYRIPIHNDPKYGREGNKVFAFKIANNHLYHIHLRFHGKKIYRLGPKYTVEAYTGKEVNVPAFT